MITDNEKWQGNSEENNDAGRDGNRSFNRDGYNRRDDNRPSYNRDNGYNREGGNRPPRPRFNNQDDRVQRPYNRDGADRPYRPYNRDNADRPSYNRDNSGRPSYNRDNSDRPSYNRDNGDRPSYNRDNSDRPQRSYNRDSYNRDGGMDRPQRSYNNNRYNNDRPQRSYNNREERPWRNNSDEFTDRPLRRPVPNSQAGSHEGGEARPRRPRFTPGGDRPQRVDSRYQQSNNRPVRRRTDDYNPNAKYSVKKQIEYKEQFVDPNEPIRLNKFLANAGVCSRREADEFITAGVVSVNGVVVTELGTKVKRSDVIKFHEESVNIERKIYVLLNKPKDCVTTSDDPQSRKTVMDFVKGACTERIYPVGRLDRNTTGVLLLTNDGDLASKLTHPKYLKKKIYHVQTDKNVTNADMDQIAAGVQLEDGEIHADEISYTDDVKKNQVGIEIHSGKNRIVRRIFESLGYKVVKLDRVFFAGLTKKGLKRGDWRYLTETEVNMLRMGAFE